MNISFIPLIIVCLWMSCACIFNSKMKQVLAEGQSFEMEMTSKVKDKKQTFNYPYFINNGKLFFSSTVLETWLQPEA